MSDAAVRFAHLHQHTAYSLLDGAARIKDLVNWVKEVSPDRPAVAMTDHGNMHGAIEFYKAASGAGVKPILGFEAYVAPGSRFEKRRGSSKIDGGYFHLTLLAKDFEGYKNLCKLSSRAYLEGFYMKPRIDLELLGEHSQGVIALSGCLGAQLPRTILDLGVEEGERVLNQYLSIFGDRYFIEIQNHGLAEQARLNPVLRSLADKYGVGMVATNDGHYVRREDAHAHDALLAIQMKKRVSDKDRMRFECEEFYVKTPSEMAAAVPEADYPGALDNTNVVADMCDVELPIGSRRVYQMPELKLDVGVTLVEQLRVDVYRGLTQRYPEVDEAALAHYLGAPTTPDGLHLELARAAEASRVERTQQQPEADRFGHELIETFTAARGADRASEILKRAEYELGVIISMGFSDYFLIVSDYVNWAKRNGIAVGPGRGSGSGSIVAYSLGITNIEPLTYDLLFERFLNPERVSMPDFDVDFSDVRRGEVVDYVREKYGEDRVTLIATFGTMASKAAIKDAARVLEVPFNQSDEASKLVPVVQGRSVSIEKALSEVPELKKLYDEGAKHYIDVAKSLEGLTRHASVHAAGVIIARDPVQELAPVFRTGDGPVVCQYDMGSIEELGFLKMDILGLRTLSFIEAAVRIVEESSGVKLDPDSFPMDDPAVYELLSRGDTAGVFQFESSGMTDTLRKLKPTRIHDLIAVGALFRPGPMGNIPTYIRRHHGLERTDYSDFPKSEERLAPILAETYGIPVYQEQVMQIARAVAGFTLGQADIMRRAMGKKKKDEMARQRELFQAGAKANGIDAAESGRIFDMLERFADYGFPKGHAAAYGVLSYQTAYLKTHYPVEFAAALLSVERGDSDKVAQYIADARHMHIDVLAPDINASGADFTPDDGVIRFGLYGIKNVGESAVDHLMTERRTGGPFKDLFDFCRRVDSTVVNKRAVEYLIKAGAFDSLAPRQAGVTDDHAARAVLLANLEHAVKWGAAQREQEQLGQLSLFGAATGQAEPVPELREAAGADALDRLEILRFEKEALGIYISEHPINSYPGLLEAASCSISQVEGFYLREGGALGGRARAVLSGLIQNVSKRPTKAGGMMARFDLADESGSVELVAFNRRYEQIAAQLEEDKPAIVVVELSPDGEGMKVVVERLIRWDLSAAGVLADENGGNAGSVPEIARLSFEAEAVDKTRLLELRSALDEHSGALPLQLELRAATGSVLYRADGVRVASQRLGRLSEEFPWVKVSRTVDRDALLAQRVEPAWGKKKEPEGELSPF